MTWYILDETYTDEGAIVLTFYNNLSTCHFDRKLLNVVLLFMFLLHFGIVLWFVRTFVFWLRLIILSSFHYYILDGPFICTTSELISTCLCMDIRLFLDGYVLPIFILSFVWREYLLVLCIVIDRWLYLLRGTFFKTFLARCIIISGAM